MNTLAIAASPEALPRRATRIATTDGAEAVHDLFLVTALARAVAPAAAVSLAVAAGEADAIAAGVTLARPVLQALQRAQR